MSFFKDIVIPDSVTEIGNSAFYKCTSLESIAISDSVTSIGKSAFYICTSLGSIEAGAENKKYASYGGILYNKEKTQIVHVPKAIKGAVTIPNGVTFIGDYAFSGCTSLERVTIGNGVTSIDYQAFRDCTSLKEIKYNGTIEQWEKIEKGEDWDLDTLDYIIYCTDGKIHKDGKAIKY